MWSLSFFLVVLMFLKLKRNKLAKLKRYNVSPIGSQMQTVLVASTEYRKDTMLTKHMFVLILKKENNFWSKGLLSYKTRS